MGNSKPASKSNNDQGSEEMEHYYDEVIQYQECCGIQRKKVVKKSLIWQDNFQRNCEDLHMYYDWVHDLQQTVKTYGRSLPRKKFLDEVNALRVIDRIQIPKQNQILLSPSEIDQFKINLKNSVLLSYGQALKPSRPKEVSKIQSIIFSSSTKQQKNLNMSSSFNNPPSIKRKSQFPHDQIRKDSILKEREKTLRQSYSKSGLRQSIMSFVDDTMSNLFRGHEKQISKQSAHCLEIFLKFSLILEKHLNSKQNIICAVIESFTNYIYKKYTVFESSQANKIESQLSQASERQKQVLYLDEIEQKMKNKIKKQRFKQLQKRKSLTTQQMQELTTDIKIFLVLLREMIQDYYKTNEFSHQFVSQTNEVKEEDTQRGLSQHLNINTLITNQDNILILVTAILFKRQKFYNHIMILFKKFHRQRSDIFKNIIDGLKDRPPEYFQIKGEYCLNEVTLDKFRGKNNNINSLLSQIQEGKEEGNKSLQQQQIGKVVEGELKDKVSKTNKPYKKCAQTLEKMLKSRTPSSKMKVIMECSQKITESVAQFYNANNIQLKNHVLDADQILSIFCYVLATNSLENIHANLFMIQHFATENQMISVTGYYYSVLTIAVQQLENMYSSTVADIQSISRTQQSSGKEHSVSSKKHNKSFGKNSIKDGKEKIKKGLKKAD